jgi:hypothetical protein
MRLSLMLAALLLLAVNIQSSSGQRLIGTVYSVNNAGLLNVYQHSGGGAQTTFVLIFNCEFA